MQYEGIIIVINIIIFYFLFKFTIQQVHLISEYANHDTLVAFQTFCSST